MLAILAGVQFTNVLDFMIMMPLGPQLMRVMDINPQQFSFVVSAYTLSAGVFGFLGAFFIDRYDRKRLLTIVYTGFLLGTLFCGVSGEYIILVIARVFTGMFGGILGAMVLSIIGDAIPLERRATAMGSVMIAFAVASVVGVPFGLYLATHWGWNMPFFLLALLGTAVLAGIQVFVPGMSTHIQKEGKSRSPREVVFSILQNKNQQFSLAMMIFIILSQFTYISMLSPFLVSNVGFKEVDLTYIYLLGGAASIVSSPIAGRLADKFGKANIFTIFSILAMIPTLLITNMGITPMYLVLVVSTLNFVFISGRMIPASTLATSAVNASSRGAFMSINSSIQQLSSGLGALLAGMVVHKNAKGAIENYNFIGLFAVLCSVASLYFANKIKSQE